MKNRLQNLLFVFIIMIGLQAFSQIETTDSLIQKIDNKDAYLVMLQNVSARVNNENASKIIKIGKQATPNLIKVLDSQDKGIAIHFILTEIWKNHWDETLCCNVSNDGYREIVVINGLKIYIEDNKLYSEKEDLKKNKETWTKLWHA